jgi:hypothetical protein
MALKRAKEQPMSYRPVHKIAARFDKILEPKDVSNPQHISFEANPGKLIYIYTGILNVEHGAGGAGTALTVGFPLIGFFGTAGQGNGNMGIIDFAATDIFKGAVATVSLANVESKGNSKVGIDLLHADLRPVVLRPSDQSIKAVVLTLTVEAEEGVLGWVGYQVTVVQINHRGNTILVGSPAWDGTYADVGDILLPGVPQPS